MRCRSERSVSEPAPSRREGDVFEVKGAVTIYSTMRNFFGRASVSAIADASDTHIHDTRGAVGLYEGIAVLRLLCQRLCQAR
jgi:hypothetical protein